MSVLTRTTSMYVRWKSKLAGAIERILADKLEESVSALDFGVDNTGTVDCTELLNVALGSYATANRVLLPPGKYLISDYLFMGIRKSIIGSGADVTEIIFDSADTSKVKAIIGDAYSCLEGVSITNMQPAIDRSCIVSNSQAVTNGWVNGSVRDVRIKDFAFGIDGWAGLGLGLMFSNIYERVTVENFKVGFRVGAGSNNNVYSVCTFINGVRPFHFNNCTTMTVHNPAFENCTDFDLVIEASSSMHLIDTYHEPTRGILSIASTGKITNAHLTNFYPTLANFLTATSDSHWLIDGAFDENAGGTSTASQFWYINDNGSTVATRNCRVGNGGIQKGIRRGDNGYVEEAFTSGGWYVQKFANGYLTMDYNSEAVPLAIMTGSTATYEASISPPAAFSGLPSVSASIWANASNSFLGVESPKINARAKLDGTIGVSATRIYASYQDGYYYSIKVSGRWK